MLAALAMVASLAVPAAAQAATTSVGSDLRIGVLGVANAIAAMGRTPELAAPLPFTRTSVADVLQLDDVVTADLVSAMAGTDLEQALEEVRGITAVLDEGSGRMSFAYDQTVVVPALELVHDDGDLRFGANGGAGELTVTLATPAGGERFVVEVDASQPDPLLRFALVSEPELELTVDIDGAVGAFPARQGFTEIDVTGGQYELHRAADIRLRDPNGRGLLTLEDLRYSNLVDLYRVERDPAVDEVDISFGVALPSEIAIEGTGGPDPDTGTLTLAVQPVDPDTVWPDTADRTQDYGDALDALTGLSLVDGVTGLAEYTGAALVLQDAADVNFPNLGGSITDLFAPADELLDLLATSAVAEIRCGLTPENPPAGNAAPGDTVYCDAVTATGLAPVTSAVWSVADGGTVSADAAAQLAAAGASPDGTVRIDGSDGQPDVVVVLTFDDGSTMTARSLPRTIQDVTSRISALGGTRLAGTSAATVNLTADRLDVDVALTATTASADLPVGDPSTLGALVGLTGLSSGGDAATATATAGGASFDVGFGIPTGEPDDEADVQSIDLLPADATLLQVDTVSAAAPTGLTGLSGRIGFLGVDVDVTDLTLGDHDGAPVVELTATSGATAIALEDLLTEDGTLVAAQVALASQLVASIAFTAEEQAMPAPGGYATGADGPASGGAAVVWGASGLPSANFDTGYEALRIFDPVPAAFLSGTASVTDGTTTFDDADGNQQTGDADAVEVDVTGNLFAALRVPADPDGDPVEVARRLVGPGVSCQNVTIVDSDTLTCEGLAPDGTAAYVHGDAVDLIVLGDPFALRDGIIDGLAASLNEFDRLDGDNLPDDGHDDDQYTSTLPLVDLIPAQLAVEREDIADGLLGVVDAATVDESGAPGQYPVSSAQELAVAVPELFGAGSTLEYDIVETLAPPLTSATPSHLGVAVSAADTTTLVAPLRFPVPGTGQVVSDGDVTVDVDSSTTVATIVDVATGRPGDSDRAASSSTATLSTSPQLEGLLRAGVGELTVTAGSTTTDPATSSASLDVTVATGRVAEGDPLTTTRTGDGATANLDVDERADDLVYTAAATDSSGGSGAVQPDPEPMQVRFLAEGLDGLAAALDGGLDGASPRVTGPEGAPVAAPLIGSDLDAGAEIADSLTALTSLLRDQLELVDVQTAAELETAVEDAVTAALDDESDEISGSGTTVTVTCDDCPTTDGPTVWDSVSVTTTLAGEERDGETEFSIGLDGINVRSDQLIDTTTSWTLPITLELVRGVGPQVTIAAGDALELSIAAELPEAGDVSDALGATATGDTCNASDHTHCIPAIIGYLPGMLTTTSEAAGAVDTTVSVALADGSHDLFELYDGVDATTGFLGDDTTDVAEDEGLKLDFETVASEYGSFDLTGTINVPWTAQGGSFTDPDDATATSEPVGAGFQKVSYTDVKLDVGEVIATLATPFDVVDPYLGPARDVIDVLRTPIPVVSDISEMAGGGSISLLSIVESFGGTNPKLDLAIRVSGFLETAVEVVGAVAVYAEGDVPLEDLAASGALLTVAPTAVQFASSCTQTVKTRTSSTDATTGATTSRKSATTTPCPPPGDQTGARNQTKDEQRRGNRNTKTTVATTTKSITGSAPGFSIPFLADPDQIVDVLTGEGEATYFRLDFGTLQAKVAYTRKFGPIMAGPVPIVPFIGGSITIEGRMAAGFDSMPQTLAVRSVPKGDVGALIAVLDDFEGGDILREAFYLDDLDADGVDVPEVKLITTLEAGAGVSIGIVTAGLKGGVTLTINLDLDDPNGDGRIRTVEIREVFNDNPSCLFIVSSAIEAFLQIFVEIDLLLTTKYYAWDIVRFGPYELFRYECPNEVPTLVVEEAGSLALTSGVRDGRDETAHPEHRNAPSFEDRAEDYEVRQFDTDGGAAVAGGTTTFEIDAINRVQRVTVDSDGDVTIFKAGVALSTEEQSTFTVANPSDLRFVADGNDGKDDRFSFLMGEAFDENDNLRSTPFTAPVTLHGHGGDDILVTGDGDDTVTGGAGVDSISTNRGDDVITAGAGNDIVEAGAGLDDVDGGGGNDRLQGGPGPDRIAGGAGDDSLQGGPGRDVRAVLLEGAEYPTPQEQVELGFDSGDVLVGGPGGDAVDGGDGSDIVVGGDASTLTSGPATALVGAGTRSVNVINETTRAISEQNVTIQTAVVPTSAELDGLCTSGAPITGAAGGDLVTGGPEADVVIGGDGTDDLDGGGGPDELCGRAGDDNISGDGGVPPTEAGNDVIRGGHGNDLVDAGPGEDVAYGDDVDLFRGGVRVLDGSLGTTYSGDGDDYITGADGGDVLAGGAGSDLLRGGAGDDRAYGEGSDTVDVGGAAPSLEDRLVACNPTTRIVHGHVDLNGDLLAGTAMIGDVGGDITPDDGRLAGLEVADGVLLRLGSTDTFTGLVAGETVVIAGLVDLDRDGTIGSADTGTVALASMLGTTAANTDGDCILGEDGDDDLRGGSGSDHVDAGAGLDLIGGGDGNDLLIGGPDTDVIVGGPHHDVLVGGDGDDHLVGGEGDDRLRGNGGDDDLVGGTDSGGATDGQDVLLGGRGEDVLAGENATVVSGSIVDAVDGAPWIAAGIVPAAATADVDDTSLRYANSAVTCRGGDATRWVTLLAGGTEVRTPAASPGGPNLYDELYGGFGCDWVFGQQGDDLVRGGQDGDVVEGGPGDDTGYGDAGDDVVIGGSSVDQDLDGQITVGRSGAGAADGDDTLYGDGGPDGLVGADLIIGDNGTPHVEHVSASALVFLAATSAPSITVELADVPLVADGALSPTTVFGDDVIDADGGEDRVFGQSGDDQIAGGEGEDELEGNAGADTVWGQEDDDVILGGSRTAGVHDDGDHLYGGGGADLALGDNALVTGDVAPVDKAVVLHDVPGLDSAGLAVSGGDTAGNDFIWGDDASGDTGTAMADRIYGQADDDTIHGQAGDDDLQGNAGNDTIYGEDGQDRIVGGSASDQSGLDGADHVFRGVADGDDDLAGGAGTDRIAGDNAVISTDGTIQQADIRVLAVEPLPGSGVAGGDLIHGDDAPDGEDLSTGSGAPDVIRGQSGNDTVHGQVGDDDIEGNAGADTIYGHEGDDDIVGGSRQAGVDDGEVGGGGDWISGGADADWIVGDNALLERHTDGTVQLLDLPVAGAEPQPHADTAGGDVIHGDSAGTDPGTSGAADVIYGQSGDDQIDGQDGDDVIDGNAGADTLLGSDGDDALVGGSSADDGTDGLVDGDAAVVPTAGPGMERRLLVGLTDDGDTISGGPGVDVVLGDNGVVAGHGIPATWRLHDVNIAGAGDHAHADVAGPDVLSGDAGTDVVLGQGGDDRLSGGDADDSLHGGPDDDIVQGDGGADDLVGGSSHHWIGAELVELRTVVDGADVLFGNAPTGDCAAGLPATAACDEASTDPGGDLGDVVIGDNGHVTRDGGADVRLEGPDTDVNTGDPIRAVLLYDVDVVDAVTFPFPPAASGADTVFAAAGRDRIFGQAGPDELYGQAGDDEIEGNGGNDLIVGGEDSDDLIGGSSSDVDGLVQAGPFPDGGTDVADGDDEILAGEGDDVALGDNGIILRPVSTAWEFHAAPYGHVRRSTVEVAFAFEQSGAFGDDLVDAGAGHDDARGQLGDDRIHGRDGDDTLIGDLGHLVEHDVVAADDPRTGSETIPADALDEPVFRTGSLYREVELFEAVGGDPEVSTSPGTGDDVITGGAGNDVIHAGSGADVVNGHGDIEDDGVPGEGDDVLAVQALDDLCAADPTRLACDEDEVFAGHGDDQVWGGPGHDRLFGGHNDDDLDVIRVAPTTPAPFSNPDVDYVGVDLIFGGWGQDALQADRSVNGPDPGDRLIDSAGAYNAFFVCDGGLGDSTAIRQLSPATITFLENVAIAAGASLAASTETSGWWSLANVYNQDVKHNNSPAHPEQPGNFVCIEPAEDPEPTGPTAAFSWDCTDLACTFTDESTSSTAVTDWTWAWDFGDGTTSTDQSPSHTFADPGTYDVELTVTADGQTASATEQVEAGLILEAVGSKEKGQRVVDLSWNDATIDVHVWRNQDQLAGVVATGGTYRDEVASNGSYTYKVCDATDPTVCSADVTVTF